MSDGKRTVNFSSSKKLSEVTVGVLAVQGSFYEHVVALHRLNDDIYSSFNSNINESVEEKITLNVIDIRSSKDVVAEMDGLIIPGRN